MQSLLIGENWYNNHLKDRITEGGNSYLGRITENDLQLPSVGSAEIVHVCFPYHEFFLENVENTIRILGNGCVYLLHSINLPIGTTRKLSSTLHEMHPASKIYHAPIFTDKVFIPVGGDDDAFFPYVADYLAGLGYESRFYKGSERTEAASIISSYYDALMHLFTVDIKKFCDKHDVEYGDEGIAEACEVLSLGKTVGAHFSRHVFNITKPAMMMKTRFGVRSKLSRRVEKQLKDKIYDEFETQLSVAHDGNGDGSLSLVDYAVRKLSEDG